MSRMTGRCRTWCEGARSAGRGRAGGVLQGGGALRLLSSRCLSGAARKAGIRAGLESSATSIGAINASLIAGNEPQARLSRFAGILETDGAETRPGIFGQRVPGFNEKLSYWSTITPRRCPASSRPNPLAHGRAIAYVLGPERAGYYNDHAASKKTLERGWSILISSIAASRGLPSATAHVRTSQMRYFDSRDCAISVKHVDGVRRAAAGLSPAVRIEGELLTGTGGILSNTPTEAVFDDKSAQEFA